MDLYSAQDVVFGKVAFRGGRRAWRRRYAALLTLTDFAVLSGVVAIAQAAKFGTDVHVRTEGFAALSYTTVSVLFVITWMIALSLTGARDHRTLLEGAGEYRRVIVGTLLSFGVFAMVAVVLKADLSRAYVAVALPLGTFVLLLTRVAMRRWQQRRCRKGLDRSSVLLVGGTDTASVMARRIHEARSSGLRVTAIWVPDRPRGFNEWLAVEKGRIPVYGAGGSTESILGLAQPDLVIVTDADHFAAGGLKELAWQVAEADAELLVSPSVLDVAERRIELTTIGSIPMVHVSEPAYAEAAAWPKVIFDRVCASMLVLLLSPALLVIALAVKLSSDGPVFYFQERIGKDGVPFRMIKFRSMHVGADAQLRALLQATGQDGKPQGKLVDDPRVTAVGRVLRRYSLDELPQLFNVLAGSMSLVGPRPQRQFEVDLYDEVAHRRLRVRPGVTGLWQVSGRSDLEWEDAIRLDTYYVENWSMVGDMIILLKTVRAVTTPSGAY